MVRLRRSPAVRGLVSGLGLVVSHSRASLLKLLVMALASGVAGAVLPLAIAQLLRSLLHAGSVVAVPVGEWAPPVALMCGVVVVDRVLDVWRQGLLDVLSLDIRVAAHRSVASLTSDVPIDAFEHSDFYDAVGRAQSAASLRPTQMAQALLRCVTSGAAGVGTAVAVVVLQPVMFGAALLTFIPAWWLVRARSGARLQFIVEATPTERRMGYLSSVLSARECAKDLRVFAAYPFITAMFEAVAADRLREVRREAATMRRVEAKGVMLAGAVAGASWAVVGVFALRDGAPLADLLTFVFAFQRLRGFMTTLAWSLAEAAESAILLLDLDHLETVARRLGRSGAADALPAGTLQTLELSGVTYRYPGASSPSLRDVDVTLRQGELVAIVGDNGSGKSTLMRILAGLSVPEKGRLLWNGRPCAGIDLSSSPGRIAAVFQDPHRFALSVVDTVAFGRAGFVGSVAELLGDVGMAAVVERLPHAEATMLSRQFDDGWDLSGGQWQRLMIARALLDPAVELVLLDEASSGLDPAGERELVTRLRASAADRVIVLVTHRLSSVAGADRVLVMREGEIVQDGPPEALLRQQGPFHTMFSLQSRAVGLSDSPPDDPDLRPASSPSGVR